jgi:gluconokinase
LETYLLAIDIGTTSTKGLAIRPDGEILSNFQKEYPTYYTQSGSAEQDPEEVFQAVVEIITQSVQFNSGGFLAGVSFSGAMHSLLAVGKAGEPLTRLMTWADTRSAKQAEELRSTALGKTVYSQTGTPIHPMSPLCKLMWMKEEQPGLFREAYKFISMKEYVFARLFGEYVVDYSIASASGLFDVHSLTWSSGVLRLLNIEEGKLSRPVSPYHRCSGLSSDWATRLPISRETPFIVGANDGCLAHLGCGAMSPGDLSVTIGTSGAVRMASSSYYPDQHSRIFNYRLDEHTFIAGGATNNGAVLLTWFEENIEGVKHDGAAFVEEAFSIPGSEGLIFLPFLLGERAPMYDPQAKGVFLGIRIQHKKAHFKRAILEGISFELKSIAQAVEEVIHPIGRVIASGGFVKSDRWVQLLSDILGKPIIVNSQNDASSLGAALQGFQALGIKTSMERKEELEKSFVPNEKNHQYYQKVFEIMEPLYDKLKGDFAKLSKLGPES